MNDNNSPHHKDTNKDSPLTRAFAYARPTFPILQSMAAVRPLAYASEVGESMKSVVHPYVYRTFWGMSIAYVFADTAVQVRNLSECQGVTRKDLIVKTADTAMWHSLASLIVPGVTIHTIVKLANKCISYAPSYVPRTGVTLFPPLLGLASIPFIIHPIDHATDRVMDNTFRKLWPSSELA